MDPVKTCRIGTIFIGGLFFIFGCSSVNVTAPEKSNYREKIEKARALKQKIADEEAESMAQAEKKHIQEQEAEIARLKEIGNKNKERLEKGKIVYDEAMRSAGNLSENAIVRASLALGMSEGEVVEALGDQTFTSTMDTEMGTFRIYHYRNGTLEFFSGRLVSVFVRD